ncbi:MAG: beta-lactamase family protein [Lautropia sp.]|nr:beta-lactamase family protein [Lautropia sp.]
MAAFGGAGASLAQTPQGGAVRIDAAGLKPKADSILDSGVTSGDVPGVVAAATDRDGLIYQGAFGSRVLGTGSMMTTDTVFWIASMTKAVTGMAAMQLVEQGRLSLDDPAGKILPALAEVQVLDGWDGDTPRLRAPKRPVTLRHLLTHTAGFSYSLWNPDIGKFEKVRNLPDIVTCKNDALKTPLVADPGEAWNYGINIDFAGKMVEAVSGMRLGEYMAKNMFGPMGMNSTGFRITPDMRARLAKVHQRSDAGKLAPIDLELPQDPEFEMGGGGLYSTAGDYLAFVRMMLNEGKVNGNQVLKPQTVAEMSRNSMGNIKVTMLKTAVPSATNDAEFFPGMPKNWSLSFMINEQEAPTGRSPGSLAWAGLANTYYWIDQKKGVGGVYLSQILPFADAKALPHFYAFEKAVYQALA